MLQVGLGGCNHQHVRSLLNATRVIAYIMGSMLAVLTGGIRVKNTDRPRREGCRQSRRAWLSARSAFRDGLAM